MGKIAVTSVLSVVKSVSMKHEEPTGRIIGGAMAVALWVSEWIYEC
jgi:hypothetical protein